MKTVGKILKTALTTVMVLAIGLTLVACGDSGTSAEKTIKVTAVNSHSDVVELGFEGGIEDLLYIDLLEIYDDGTYKMTTSMNGYAQWLNMSVQTHVAELYGTWTEGENSDEYSLFATLSAPTRVISYAYAISDSEITPPIDSATLSGEELTALLGEYSEMSVEVDYETGNYVVQ